MFKLPALIASGYSEFKWCGKGLSWDVYLVLLNRSESE
jgi:hypothetical protein